ncbi:MAG: hypothetical protein GY758_12195 [Fuerstiella sp.]|nr:hypothetical protein [Fuerstiella sp.]MCP4510337.1 hypothetical protein [Fuerstiella sp.]MCP4786023.1 hypothetical protein [Fuerstiella sp.]MCP4856250.1 hypothetical protein [Fuerstiella sp.]
MFHSECHAAFTLPEHVVATDDFRRRDYATDLEIRSDLETRCNLEYPGDLDLPHKRTPNILQPPPQAKTLASRSG